MERIYVIYKEKPLDCNDCYSGSETILIGFVSSQQEAEDIIEKNKNYYYSEVCYYKDKKN